MKRLCVQLQPARTPGLDVDAAVKRLQALSPASVTRGEDDEPYTNVEFQPADVRSLWAAVERMVQADPLLAASTIICCEGSGGWADDLLLHHFDPTASLDDVS